MMAIAKSRQESGYRQVEVNGANLAYDKTPTLVMTGEQSPAGLRVIAAELARLVPNAHTVDIPGASHVMHLDNPQATVRAIEGFLGSN